MSLQNVELLWKELGKYGGMFAGGCIRDSVLGQTVKDYDFYIPENRMWELQRDYSLDNFQIFTDKDDMYNHQYLSARAAMKLHDLDVDILVTHVSSDIVIDAFDFGICKCWYDGELHLTDAFHEDARNKQHTLFRLNWGMYGCFDHLARLQQKYLWPVVIDPATELQHKTQIAELKANV